MTRHHPKPKDSGHREPRRLTLGNVFGAALRKALAEQQRRAELDDMGFRAIKSEQ